MIRTSGIIKFNCNSSFLLFLIQLQQAIVTGAHHLTTAEVLNFLSFCIYKISLNSGKVKEKKKRSKLFVVVVCFLVQGNMQL